MFFLSFQVKIWFQNRRTKWKKQDNVSNTEAAEHKSSKGASSSDESKSRIPDHPNQNSSKSHHPSSASLKTNSTSTTSDHTTTKLSSKLSSGHNTKLKNRHNHHHSNNHKSNLKPEKTDKLLSPPPIGILANEFSKSSLKHLSNDKSHRLANHPFLDRDDVESRLTASKISVSAFKTANNIPIGGIGVGLARLPQPPPIPLQIHRH